MSNKLTLHKLTPTKRSSPGPYFGRKRRERQKTKTCIYKS